MKIIKVVNKNKLHKIVIYLQMRNIYKNSYMNQSKLLPNDHTVTITYSYTNNNGLIHETKEAYDISINGTRKKIDYDDALFEIENPEPYDLDRVTPTERRQNTNNEWYMLHPDAQTELPNLQSVGKKYKSKRYSSGR